MADTVVTDPGHVVERIIVSRVSNRALWVWGESPGYPIRRLFDSALHCRLHDRPDLCQIIIVLDDVFGPNFLIVVSGQ